MEFAQKRASVRRTQRLRCLRPTSFPSPILIIPNCTRKFSFRILGREGWKSYCKSSHLIPIILHVRTLRPKLFGGTSPDTRDPHPGTPQAPPRTNDTCCLLAFQRFSRLSSEPLFLNKKPSLLRILIPK